MPIKINTGYAEQADIADGNNNVAVKRQGRDTYHLLCDGEILVV
jgi:hypothetical protein